jgi:hypothetical protein
LRILKIVTSIHALAIVRFDHKISLLRTFSLCLFVSSSNAHFVIFHPITSHSHHHHHHHHPHHHHHHHHALLTTITTLFTAAIICARLESSPTSITTLRAFHFPSTTSRLLHLFVTTIKPSPSRHQTQSRQSDKMTFYYGRFLSSVLVAVCSVITTYFVTSRAPLWEQNIISAPAEPRWQEPSSSLEYLPVAVTVTQIVTQTAAAATAVPPGNMLAIISPPSPPETSPYLGMAKEALVWLYTSFPRDNTVVFALILLALMLPAAYALSGCATGPGQNEFARVLAQSAMKDDTISELRKDLQVQTNRARGAENDAKTHYFGQLVHKDQTIHKLKQSLLESGVALTTAKYAADDKLRRLEQENKLLRSQLEEAEVTEPTSAAISAAEQRARAAEEAAEEQIKTVKEAAEEKVKAAIKANNYKLASEQERAQAAVNRVSKQEALQAIKIQDLKKAFNKTTQELELANRRIAALSPKPEGTKQQSPVVMTAALRSVMLAAGAKVEAEPVPSITLTPASPPPASASPARHTERLHEAERSQSIDDVVVGSGTPASTIVLFPEPEDEVGESSGSASDTVVAAVTATTATTGPLAAAMIQRRKRVTDPFARSKAYTGKFKQ